MNFEGSTEVDNGRSTSQVQENLVETESEDLSENLSEGSEESDQKETKEAEEQPQEVEEEDQPKYTEKGTKLDKNPQSAVHQELANERRLRSDYEKVLRNPELLKKFAKEAGYSFEEAKEVLEEEVYQPEKLQTAEDVAKALNDVRKEALEVKKENERLRSDLERINSTRKTEVVASAISSDINAVREEYPELNPKSPDYDPELEKEIGELYHELDFDSSSQTYKGQYSLARITERIMRAAGKAKKKGSEQAQMDIKVKQTGRVVTSAKPTQDNGESSKDPATVIAQRIAKSFKN